MKKDIDIVIERVRFVIPDVQVEQLKVAHPGADDDGIWYFSRPDVDQEISVESGTYSVPFLLEHDRMARAQDRIMTTSLEETAQEVIDFLCREAT